MQNGDWWGEMTSCSDVLQWEKTKAEGQMSLDERGDAITTGFYS